MTPTLANKLAHRWLSVLVALPLLVVILTGVLLLVKKEVPAIQPAEQRGAAPGAAPKITPAAILDACRAVPEARVRDWADIRRVDIRPAKGMAKVLCRDDIEVQLDTADARVLQVAKRRSDWIASIHDGSILGDAGKYALALPVALVALLLWFTGLWLFVAPYVLRRRSRAEASARS